MSLFLVRYGELGLKSPRVRKRFENTLKRNIEDAFLKEKAQCVIDSDWGRIYLHSNSDEKTKKILRKIVGITSFSPVIECTSQMEDICNCASEYSKSQIAKEGTFAVRAKRTGEHHYTSQELASEVGSAILKANQDKKVKVKLTNPDCEIFVEVRHKRAFVFGEKIEGPGGFPMGTQGRVLAIISDKKSLLAAWLLLKRGCTLRMLCQDEEAMKQAKLLSQWYVPSKPVLRPAKSLEEMLSEAMRVKAQALVLGSTYSELSKEDLFIADIPVFYPLAGMKDKEIRKRLTSLFCDGS